MVQTFTECGLFLQLNLEQSRQYNVVKCCTAYKYKWIRGFELKGALVSLD